MALSAKQEEAATLLAADHHSVKAICDELEIKSRKTLYNWLALPEFKSRVEEIRAEILAQVRHRGIALVENRVAELADRHQRMKRVIEERAEDSINTRVAGGTTGLLAHMVKAVGRGEDFQLIDTWEVDTGLLREMRETEKQVSIELGQWMEKSEVTNKGSIVVRSITAVQPTGASSGDVA